MSDQDPETAGTAPAASPVKKPRVSTARESKRKRFFLLQVGPDEWYRLRRADLPTLFFEGLLPTPILHAIDGFQKVRREMNASDTIADALAAVSPENRALFLELLRRCAVVVVVTPKLTHSKLKAQIDDSYLWVGGLSDVPGEDSSIEQPGDVPLMILMHVWRAILNEGGIVIMPDDEALEFRPYESGVSVSPVSDVAGLRTETVVVDPSELAHVGADAPVTRQVRFVAHE